MKAKKDLRKKIFAKRAAQDPVKKNAYDQEICQKMEQLIIEKKGKTVHAYLPMGDEIDINPLLQKLLDLGIRVITSKTLKNRHLEHLELNSLDDLEEGLWGTWHPANSEVFEGQVDLVIIPGLAFDQQNNRLGYGGGYYDNFLIKQSTAYKIAICYPFQMVEEVPVEPHDFVLDEVLCFDF
jgi:5-formyltetrahydrofolate cyclo-ligase